MQPTLDSFEILPDRPLQTNGVPRSAWKRTRRTPMWHRVYVVALVLLDFLGALFADLTSITLFDNKAESGLSTTELFPVIAYVLLPLGWVIVLWAHGCYDRRYLGVGTDEFKRALRASWTVVAVVAFMAFAQKRDLSRMTVGVALLGALTYILLLRYLARSILHLTRNKTGLAVHRMVLVGTLPETLEVHAAITRNPSSGLVPVAISLTEGYTRQNGRGAPVPVYAGREIASLVSEHNADTIAVCGNAGSQPGELRRLAWQLEGTGVDLVVAPQLTDIAGPRVHIRPVEGLPLLYVEEPTLSGVGWLVKNVLDRLVAFVGLIVLLPVFLLIAIAIRLSDKGPVFFRQSRTGREGQMFRVWKFRTMYTDAEDRLAALDESNESDGMLFKIRNDPRVFPFGKFLRASSMDELPQLINVLIGEMSLVGPRPLPADDGDFLGDVRRRLLVRPGMTGLWQVSGRSDLSWDDAVRLDLYYVDNWSLVLDLHILWRTIGVVLRSKGAY
ncbi:exopolysaccharide biosynthesis polyprenyl glycosylphosphotransferase [Virgisporangium aliadipatigenens]|uniref:Exopolysaccharide biosynthesis polyprenyl glycosylphosphotransferase n=1 Tax=Virgisporangium aliadipatigenens TaxID=741659 RepID=A0A8J3YVL9_9ACTN|nr:sugar transferase [Virgisporangium aliadipatigenens]GIJ51497.1 exopolysaccharide biosynthesis polyprenyl glycosylphosphotransferase [Virgisporangium aliadipatigenens]